MPRPMNPVEVEAIRATLLVPRYHGSREPVKQLIFIRLPVLVRSTLLRCVKSRDRREKFLPRIDAGG
jgi:hypothetical protein